jgi:hypothetical protein
MLSPGEAQGEERFVELPHAEFRELTSLL